MRVGKLSGAVGNYSATDPELERIACERLGLEPEPVSTQVLPRDRHAELLSALALVAASLERFALEIRHLARTEVREVRSRSARGQKGSSAMPHKRNPVVAERICGLARVVRAAAAVGLENVPLWHERDISHSSAERVVVPDAFLALDYMLDRFVWLVEGLVVLPERMRANLDASHGLFFSQRVLLALVEAGLPRDEAYRLVQGTRCAPGTRGSTSESSSRADHGSPGGSTSHARFDLGAYTRHVDAVFERLHALTRRRRPCMSETLVHVASGKVRELFAIDEERLLLVASDRISTFDVVLPTEIPDKGRVLTGLSAFWFARTREICANHLLGARAGRALDRVQPAGDAAARVRRPRLPRGVGLEGLPARPARPPGAPCRRACASRTGCRSRSSRRRRRRRRGTTRTSTRSRRRRSSARSGSRRSRRRRSRSTGSRPTTRPRAGSSSPTRSSSSALDESGALVLADEAFTPDSSRFWPADEYVPGGPQPSFDKQYVRDYCESLGWDKTSPGPELPDDVVAGTRARYVEAFERLTGIAFDDYLADPGVALRVRATVLVRPKEGILDPQGQAVEDSLRHLGFSVGDARVGRVVDLERRGR